MICKPWRTVPDGYLRQFSYLRYRRSHSGTQHRADQVYRARVLSCRPAVEPRAFMDRADRRSLNSLGTEREREVKRRTFPGRRLSPDFSTQTLDYPLAGSKADAAAVSRRPPGGETAERSGLLFLLESYAV